jgi:hypothetical protein
MSEKTTVQDIVTLLQTPGVDYGKAFAIFIKNPDVTFRAFDQLERTIQLFREQLRTALKEKDNES